MYRVVVNYHHPEDPQAFLEHYRSTHAPLAKNLAGLSAYTWGVSETLDGSQPPFFVTAVLDWPSKDAALADLGSEQGQAASADMANFAQAGVSMYTLDLETVV
ncbi:EthD family reductase [Geodermatophilus maliterrae]|uniref:EthD family reductase n=1 Tax=Geodermatophilus maliterrae TaxID=3162531 RepID=A0ABV3X944_9ACTN